MNSEQRPAAGGEQTPSEPPAPERRSTWTAGRVIGMVLSGIGGLIGLALLIAGIAILALYLFARDDDGYFTTDSERLESAAYAITTEEIDLSVDDVDWAPDDLLGDVRIRITGSQPVFVGIGPDADVDAYLGRVARDELVDFDGGEPQFEAFPGGRPRGRPGAAGFWVAQAEGDGEQTLTWDADFGRWTAVIMNADASRGIDVEADAGVKIGWVVWVGIGLVVAGLIVTAIAVALILLIARRAERSPARG